MNRFENCKFRIAENDEQARIEIKLKYFKEYLKYNVDDSPLYIFEDSLTDDDRKLDIVEKYQIPDYFPEDLLNLVSSYSISYSVWRI